MGKSDDSAGIWARTLASLMEVRYILIIGSHKLVPILLITRLCVFLHSQGIYRSGLRIQRNSEFRHLANESFRPHQSPDRQET